MATALGSGRRREAANQLAAARLLLPPGDDVLHEHNWWTCQGMRDGAWVAWRRCPCGDEQPITTSSNATPVTLVHGMATSEARKRRETA